VKGRTESDRAHRGEEQRVAVGIGLRDILRGDGAIGAGLVLDRDRLTERRVHLVGDQPRGEVGRAAGGKGDDEAHRAGRVIVGESEGGR